MDRLWERTADKKEHCGDEVGRDCRTGRRRLKAVLVAEVASSIKAGTGRMMQASERREAVKSPALEPDEKQRTERNPGTTATCQARVLRWGRRGVISPARS